MAAFKKYLRRAALETFFAQADSLLGGKCSMAVKFNGDLVAARGCDLDAFADESQTVSRALSFPGGLAGVLQLAPADDTERAHFERCADFMAYTLQSLIDEEHSRRSIAEEALAKYRELALLHRSVPRFNNSLRLKDVVRALMLECQRDSQPGEMAALFLDAPDDGGIETAASYGFSPNIDFTPFVESAIFKKAREEWRGEIINDLESDPRWNDELSALSSLMVVPLVSPNRFEGLLLMGSAQKGQFQAAHQKHLSTVASVAGISISNAFHFEGIRVLMESILQALAEAIDSRDPFTAGHSRRVAQLAAAFALRLSEDTQEFPEVFFSEVEMVEVYYAGILHDVGKIGIREDVLTKDSRLPDRILDVIRKRMELKAQLEEFDWQNCYDRVARINKAMSPEDEELDFIRSLSSESFSVNGQKYDLLHADESACLTLPYGNLTPEERLEIMRHPAESERILQRIPLKKQFANLLTIIRQHHERMDGTGYPDALRGDEILLQSRLMAIVDVYDAITQERHYKAALSREEALDILSKEAMAGKMDGRLVSFFEQNIDRIESVADQFDTGSGSVVIHDALNFKVK